MECDSNEGEGSRFSVVVPLAHAPDPELRAPMATRVLAYATDARRRQLLEGVLRDLGAQVTAVASERELAAQLEDQDVVLIDKRTRIATAVGDIPVIVVRDAIETPQGAVQVEGNPLTRGNLLQAIDQALGRAPRVAQRAAPAMPT